MRTVDILSTADEGAKRDLSGSAVVIIDVLRATTSMFYMFESGARAVYPVGEVDAAREKKKRNPAALLCGERGGVAPEGFDMGNSPASFKSADLSGKEIILTTTNGTRAVVGAQGSALIVTASFPNAASVARYLDVFGPDLPVFLLCAGTKAAFSIEDFFCAGIVAAHLSTTEGTILTDFAWAAVKLSELPVEGVINQQTCRHLGFLMNQGFSEDIKISLSRDGGRNDLTVPMYDVSAGCFIPVSTAP